MAPRKPFWAELLTAAAEGYLKGQAKKANDERAEQATSETPHKPMIRMPNFMEDKPRSASWDDHPNLPSHLKRLPGETEEQQTTRISAYLDSRRHSYGSGGTHSRGLGHIYDTHLPDKDQTERDCGACDGRGKYYGRRGPTRCGNCNGTGKVRRHIIGR